MTAYATRFQPAQPNALRILNRKYTELEHSKWSSAKTLTRELSSSAWELAFTYGQRSTIHGMNRLLGKASGKYERFVWLLTVILAFLGAIYVCLILSDRFTEGKLETVVDSTRMPVYRISFPVITICNLNHLNWQRLPEAKEHFLPHENSTEKLQLFERVIGAYDDMAFAHFSAFEAFQREPLYLLNNISFTEVFEAMTWKCPEFLTLCEWNHFPMNCCDIFSKRRSKNGLCWSFNTLESEEGRRQKLLDPFWPWHLGAAGPKSGLTVRVLINPEKHYPNRVNNKGISVMVSEPNVWHKEPKIVPADTHSLIEISPVTYFFDNDTRSLDSDVRQCYFTDEQKGENFKTLQGYIYMIENCQAECHQEYLKRYCNCTVDLLFPPGQYPACKAADLVCLAKNNEHFMYSSQPGEEQFVRNYFEGMTCKCFRNCYSLHYMAEVRSSFLSSEIRNNVSYIDLDVHYRSETMIAYRTSLIFGWVDLLVAFGGIAGLFLGCSLISGMELAYFLLIEFPTFLIDKLKRQRQRDDMEIIIPKQQQQQYHANLTNVAQNQFNDYNNITNTLKPNNQQQYMQQNTPTWNRFTATKITNANY